jgi:hypothetical protein
MATKIPTISITMQMRGVRKFSLRNSRMIRPWAQGDQLKPLILDYFSNLFTTKVNMIDPAFLEKITPRVSGAMNELLTTPFTPEEVKKAIFSIGDLKAPGPDGLHAVVYKKF